MFKIKVSLELMHDEYSDLDELIEALAADDQARHLTEMT